MVRGEEGRRVCSGEWDFSRSNYSRECCTACRSRVSLTHSPSDVGLRPPRPIVNEVEVYGWEEHKMNEPNRQEDVPPPVQEHRQPEESNSSLMQRTANVLKACVVS